MDTYISESETVRVRSDKETERIGRELAHRLSERGVRRAFIAMRGEMGVGKTVFTRGFASYFGISGVRSPTYTVVNEYSGNGVKIYHFDLYRISDGDDLYSIGYDDYVRAEGYCIAEWSERAEEDIPEGAIYVEISRVPTDESARDIRITGLAAAQS